MQEIVGSSPMSPTGEHMSKDEKQMRIGTTTIITQGSDILMGKRKEEGWWEFPGGKVDPGERSIVAAARREVFEEVGVALPEIDFDFVGYHEHPGRYGEFNWVNMIFHVTLQERFQPLVMEPDKIERWHWFLKRDLPMEQLWDIAKAALEIKCWGVNSVRRRSL